MNNFVPGHLSGGVVWSPTGLGVNPALNIKSHSLDISVMLHDVTHTASGGIRARLAGVTDLAGDVEADFDLDAPPYSTLIDIFPGLSGIMLFGLSALKAIQVPVIVEKKRYQMTIDSEVKYSFSVKANSRAGFFVYPAFP